MQPSQRPLPHLRSHWLLGGILLLMLVYGSWWLPRQALTANANPVTAAWEEARTRGAYHFTSDLTQVNTPLATLSNVGRSSRQTALHLEGATDLRAATMNLHLWSQDGSVSQPNSGVEVRVLDGKTQMRQPGGAWQATGDLLGGMAPSGDFLTFLAGMRAIRPLGTDSRGGLTFTRYGFQLDGPAIADHVRNQMAAALRQRGELPPGVELQAPAVYAQMTGTGELWIDQRGLPLRQTLDLQFPPQRGEVVTARIVTDFSDFAAPPATVALTTDQVQTLAASSLGLLLGLLCVTIVLTGRRSRQLYAALVIALVFAEVAGPLLQNFRISSFLDAQQARAAAQDQQQASQDEVRTAYAQAAQQAFDPHRDPIAAANVQAQADTLSAAVAPGPQPIPTPEPVTAPDNGVDSDQDGLTDFVEERIGTDPQVADTDGDGISDGAEVKGFDYAGRHWFGDPLQRDSNNDGQPDTVEWHYQRDGQPLDLDGDGVPDAFDDDNDGDGVPDQFDLSPYSKMAPAADATFSDSTPLQFQLSNLQAGKPVFVDFQLRPRDTKHLWYALNVLDWPQDVEGQIQDGDGKTFADLPGDNVAVSPSDANGDMKLIPMLEIRTPAASANLPAQKQLTAYGVAAHNLTSDGATQVIYVPLRLITDSKTGARLAFSGRMPYQATGAWSQPQQVRLVWLVQALLDSCSSQLDGQCVVYKQRNQPEIIQSYYDDWTLTGLTVREDHGAQTALIFEDPAHDPNLKDDAGLVKLAYGLEHSFLAGRDQEPDGQLDVTMANIDSAPARWGITDAFQVVKGDYPTLDDAVMTTVMTTTRVMLDRNFKTAWNADHTLKPMLLFAHQESYRSEGLDGLIAGGATQQQNGLLTIDFNAGGKPSPEQTSVGLKWTMFCGDAATGAWQGCEATTMWDELATRYAATSRLTLNGVTDTPTTGQARLSLIRLYFLALAQGVSNIVKEDATILLPPDGFLNDDSLSASIRGGGQAGKGVVAFITSIATTKLELLGNDVIQQIARLSAPEYVGTLGIGGLVSSRVLTKLKSLWAQSVRAKVGMVGAVVGVVLIALALVATLAYFLATDPALRDTVVGTALGKVVPIVAVVVPLAGLAASTVPLVQLARGLEFSVGAQGAVPKLLRGSSALAGTSRISLVVGAVIQLAVVWGIFIYQMVSSNTAFFSPQFNAALAQAIAATVIIITLAVLSATVIGLIIVAVIAVIDAILTAICELGVDDLRKVPGLNGACFTLNTAATAGLAKLIYSFDSMVDTDRTDMVTTGGPSFTLADPARGYVANNPLTISLGVTTTVVHKDPKPENVIHILPYIWLFSEDNLRGTTFKYELSQSDGNVNAERHQMDSAWSVSADHTYAGHTMYRAQAQAPTTVQNLNLPAGINQAPTLYLNTGYALPAYECWSTLGLARVCYVRTLDGHNSTKIDQLKLDILPATLDQFVAQTDAGNGGLKLNWDAHFTTLADADGDGLRSSALQGNDPNDTTWDADGDGLSDAVELSWRARGIPVSPTSWDTDGDGLSDGQELLLGTNPTVRDTDNDGLSDGEEVYHQVYAFDAASGAVQATNTWAGGWTVAITGTQPINVIVSSDPTLPDSDGDGISDQAEKELATNPDPHKRLDPDGRPYHPLIVNKNPLLVQVAVNDADRIVKPGQSVVYSTTVANLGAPLVAGGLEVNAPAFNQPLSTYRLELDQTNVVTKTTDLVVAGATSQKVNITSLARARLTNTNAPAWQWLPAQAGTLGGFTSDLPAWRTAVAPLNFSRQDSYAVTALNHSPTQNAEPYTQLFTGQTGAWSIPAGATKAFGGGQLHDASPTAVACNAFGRCFFVWSQFNGSRSVIMGMLTDQDLQPATPNAFVVAEDTAQADYDHYFHPVVASDGTNFLVVYEGIQQRRTGTTNVLFFMSSQVVARRFDANGNPLGNAARLAPADVTAGLANPLRVSYLNLAVAWVGDAYRVLWSQPVVGQADKILQVADFDAAGAIIPNTQRTIATDVKAGDQGAPQLAYDPLSKRIIVAYLDSGNLADTILFQTRSDPNPVLTNQKLALGNVGVAYAPSIRGWLLTWTPLNGGAPKQGYALLKSDGTAMPELPQQVATWSIQPNVLAGGGLACPAADSQPVLTLPFEELPGATTFTDTSGWNANATCSGAGCPLAGVAGAPGAPHSDFAIRFTGAQKLSVTIPGARGQRFSLAFWLKTSAATGGDFALVTNDYWRFVLQNGRLNYVSNQVNVTSNIGVADGQWHHIVLAQNEVTALIYVDGQLTTTPTDQATAAINAPGNVTIGAFASNTAFFTGEIDQLQVYNTTLDQATVQAIKDRTQQAYCLATAPASTAVNTLRLGVQAQDTRGGVIQSSAGLSLTVDADPPTSSITSLIDGGYIQGTPGTAQTLIIGGNASDANGIQQVNVRVNGGAWQAASGGATWTYPLQVSEGRYTLQSQAVDVAGNVESAPRTTTVLVDASAPQLATDSPENAALTPVALRVGQWQVSMQGTVSDPQLAGNPGSGVQQVDVLLQSADLNDRGNGWQPAILQDNIWSLNYSLASAPTLTGVYTVTVRASDPVGNVATLSRHVTLDGAGPNAALSALDATRTSLAGGITPAAVSSSAVISAPLSIKGTASDAGGVNTVEADFVPIQRLRAISDTLLFLPFDEGSDERVYHDISPQHTDVNCINQCIAGQPGQNGGALRMIPGTAGPLLRPQTGEFDFTAGDSFSLQSWLLTTQSAGVILSKEDAKLVGYALVLQDGVPMLRLNGHIVAKGTAAINDKRWHQIVGVVDGGAGEARLYVDGTIVSTVGFRGDLVDPKHPKWPLLIGGQVGDKGYTGLIDGFFDDVGVFRTALSPFLVQALYHTGDTVRRLVTLDQPGATTTTWQVAVPAGLEGQYQIDLRTTDNQANPAMHAAAWRGVVDSLAPRITFTAQPTGAQFAEGNGVTRYEIAYSYSAEDRYLSDKGFSGPCDGRGALVRDFADDADVAGLFPDLTLRNRLSTNCNVWEESLTPAATVNACDDFGSCTTATPTKPLVAAQVGSASVTNANAGEPSALLLAPTQGSILAVEAGEPLTMTFVAHADANLQQVAILLDEKPVATLDFAKGDAIQTTQQTVPVKLPDFDPDKFEGEHTLVAQASDWAGNVQRTLFPVTVTLDTHDPTVDLLNDKLTSADSYGVGNSMMRLHGTAADSFGLAAVQISVNGGPFTDVTFDDQGNWRTALWLGDDPAGQKLNFTLRAIDRAGHQTAMNKGLLVDVPPLFTALETTINSGPTNPSADTAATFTFSGVDAQGHGVSGFQCQLDGSAFTPCTSPQSYSGLSQGEHLFRVFASNGQGALDTTPAERTWQVGTTTPPPSGPTHLYLPLIARGATQVQSAGPASPEVQPTPGEGPTPDAPITPAGAMQTGENLTLYLPIIGN